MARSRDEILAVVERSPATVAVHARAGWLDLFTDAAQIEDPVGSPPAPKAGGTLGRFWDTFIGPHDIAFEIRHDHVVGLDVMRDAIIHTRIGPHIRIDVPAYLLYELEEVGGALQVRRMTAHWNLAVLSLGAMRLGPRAWVAMTRLFGRMLGRMGLRWVGGYLASLWRSVGKEGLRAVDRLAHAVAVRDQAGVVALFGDAGAEVALAGSRLQPADLLEALGRECRLEVEAPVAAGWTASFRYRLRGPSPSEGIALLEFAPGDRRIRRARFFAA